MKPYPQLLLLALLLLSCLDREVIETTRPDTPLTTTWCSNGRMAYQFEPDGRFVMEGFDGTTWAGHWSHAPATPDLEIILSYGPDRRIQHIHLTDIRYDETQLSALWSDETSRNLPVVWKACGALPGFGK